MRNYKKKIIEIDIARRFLASAKKSYPTNMRSHFMLSNSQHKRRATLKLHALRSFVVKKTR